MSGVSFEEVLQGQVRDLRAEIDEVNGKSIMAYEKVDDLHAELLEKDKLIEALSIKLMERDTELYTQISKTISAQDKYLELVDKMELHRKEARLLVRQLECLHSDVVLGGLCKIEAGVEMLKSDLSEEMK